MTSTERIEAVAPVTPAHGITFREAVKVWAKVAALSFGGPAGQIAVMHRILVEQKKWIGENRFLHALNFCMLLPGPEAQQLAIYIGWLLHKTKGGLVAGTLFVLPGFVCIMILSWIYAAYGNVGIVQALFFGLKAAVLAIVLEAVVRIGKRSLKNNTMIGFAAAAFVRSSSFRFRSRSSFWQRALSDISAAAWAIRRLRSAAATAAPERPPWPTLTARLARRCPTRPADDGMGAEDRGGVPYALDRSGAACSSRTWPRQRLQSDRRVLLENGRGDVRRRLCRLGLCRAAGCPHVRMAQARRNAGWPRHGRDHARTADHGSAVRRLHGRLPRSGLAIPMLAGTLGGILTTWVTFVPCFLWIFLGAPYVEALRENKAWSAALATITAAVVGVVLNLAVWFALHVLFRELSELHWLGMKIDVPVLSSINIASLLLTLGCAPCGVPVQDQHDRRSRNLCRDRRHLLPRDRTGRMTGRSPERDRSRQRPQRTVCPNRGTDEELCRTICPEWRQLRPASR